LTAPVALDDRRLECLLAQLRHLQGHLAGLGVQLAIIAAGPVVGTLRAALVALGTAQRVCLGIEQPVERAFDRAPDQLAQMLVDPLLVNLHDLAQALPAILTHGGGLLCGLLNLDNPTSPHEPPPPQNLHKKRYVIRRWLS